MERGFKRFCQNNGSETARRIWPGDLRIMEHMWELTERERNETSAEATGPPSTLFLAGDYSAAASIPIGSTLPCLEREHNLLPTAFYSLFVHDLWTWMRVYDCSAALEHAEMGMIDMDEEQLRDSPYPRVEADIPPCLRSRLKMSPVRALWLLKEIQPQIRRTPARQLVKYLMELHHHSVGHRHAWPSDSVRQIPELEEYLADTDGDAPGCLISWYENDAISACFEEEMSYMGQNGPLAPSILLPIALDQADGVLDKRVRYVFEYAGAMLRSLSTAARIVEIIRELYDEHLRQHRIKSGLQTEPGSSGVRDE